MSELLDGLNDKQREAVAAPLGNYLVLAGAGSGKTRVLTHRIAWLIAVENISEGSIMAVTFTNKAAAEMRHRIQDTLSKHAQSNLFGMWIGTFHSIAHRLLRAHHLDVNLPQDFQILDSEDQLRLVKRLMKLHNYDDKAFPPKQACWYINNKKDEGLRPQDINDFGDRQEKEWIKIYQIYQDTCDRAGLVDFAELLIRAYELFAKKPVILQRYQQRFQHILVDEFQDTNKIQYEWIRLLAGKTGKVMIVGDDDQSIYGWRGAKIENILNFKDQFKDAKVIRLEQNYRSTSQILRAANELIDHNRNRLGKELKSTKEGGEDVALMESDDETMESLKVAKRIKKLLDSGAQASDIAILYRINALSRSLEEGLTKEKIPYKMVGGVKFYERAEVKDVISYLRLVANENDDFSLKRVINRPKRGLGKVSLAKIEKIAFEHKLSLFEAISSLDENDKDLSKKIVSSLGEFAANLRELKECDSPYELVDKLEAKFGIKKYYESLPDGAERVANIDEFYATIKDQIKQNPSFSIEEFLNEIALQSEQDNIGGEAISIMSIHASKGLEFEHLFVIGLEEGFFPLLGDGSDIEEERRLAYVAITRAKKTLTLSFVNSRFYKGQRTRLEKSRFLSEAGVCSGSLIIQTQTQTAGEYKKGDLVKHKIFGIGRVTAVTKIKKELKLTINFGGISREIMSSFVEKAV
ncbi:UvrD-helicase domain-containing protein [Campylobacter showae]|uniref:UvrD-helicase domain-containing protein n=1 Tax=Campylobacter showae TaxID=204 RepID=UPI0026EBE170|nr:UvrD-helicase domain-containing protein [Campylobacter showae]